MIELDVKGYCHNCSNFTPDVERFYRDDNTVRTTITCLYEEHCERIKRFIEKKVKK